MPEPQPSQKLPPEKVLPLVQRAWLALLHVGLVLPFVVTKECDGGEVRAYTGLEYYFSPERWIFLLALVVVLFVLVVVPWAGDRSARGVAAIGLRAWVAALGAVVAVFGPFFAFLFDAPQPRVGWWIHGGGWIVTALAYLGLTAGTLAKAPPATTGARPPERWAVGALLVAPVVAALLKSVLDEPGRPLEYVVGVLTGYGVALPLALAGMAIVRACRRGEPVGGARILWWMATAPTLIVHLAAGIAD